MQTAILTGRLKGRKVLAKTTKYGVNAVGYANLTQAQNRAEKLRAEGIPCEVIGYRPFFIAISE